MNRSCGNHPSSQPFPLNLVLAVNHIELYMHVKFCLIGCSNWTYSAFISTAYRFNAVGTAAARIKWIIVKVTQMCYCNEWPRINWFFVTIVHLWLRASERFWLKNLHFWYIFVLHSDSIFTLIIGSRSKTILKSIGFVFLLHRLNCIQQISSSVNGLGRFCKTYLNDGFSKK